MAAGGVGGVALAGIALIDWHFTLQYVGVLGAQLSLIKWFTSYDSAEVGQFVDLHNLWDRCS